MPGVGATVARVLADELGDMSQFSNENKLFSYIELTPSQHSSGERIRYGSISQQGKPALRQALVQAAWIAIRWDPSLRGVFEKISNPKFRLLGSELLASFARLAELLKG